MFVAGLPIENARGTTLAFHRGVDRLLLPPHREPGRRVFALRPLARTADAHRLPDYGGDTALPWGATWRVTDEGVAPLPPPALPELGASMAGDPHLTTARLPPLARGEETLTIHVPRRADRYRITLFAGDGYLATLVPGDRDVAVIDLLNGARFGAGPHDFLGTALAVPAGLDADLRFPLLVEAGTVPPDGRFTPTAANRTPLWLELDRGYCAFVLGR
jgi:hypothetical protein